MLVTASRTYLCQNKNQPPTFHTLVLSWLLLSLSEHPALWRSSSWSLRLCDWLGQTLEACFLTSVTKLYEVFLSPSSPCILLFQSPSWFLPLRYLYSQCPGRFAMWCVLSLVSAFPHMDFSFFGALTTQGPAFSLWLLCCPKVTLGSCH